MINSYRNGAAQPNLPGSSLKNFEIPLPPLAEQQRIVYDLDKLHANTEALKNIYQQKLTRLAELKQALLAEEFGEG